MYRLFRSVVAVALTLGAARARGESPAVAHPPPAGFDSVGRTLGPISASLARVNEAASRDLHLVARLQIPGDAMLELYEPAPGALLVSLAGRPKPGVLDPAEFATADVEDLWTRLAAGRPMPSTLANALARRGPRRWQPMTFAPSSAAPVAPPDGNVTIQDDDPSNWCSDEYFNEGHYNCPPLDDSNPWRTFSDCRWHSTERRQAMSRGDVARYIAHVCPANPSSVTFSVATSGWGDNIKRWEVPAQTLRQVRWESNCFAFPFWDCPTVRVEARFNGDWPYYHLVFFGGQE
jgi:hypothetical protein